MGVATDPGAGVAIDAEDAAQELSHRLRQQQLTMEFGVFSLKTRNIDDLLQQAASVCANGLRSKLCKILEHFPGRQKTMTLDGGEFIRRFLIHVLPDGFHRIRYFGFLGNCHRARKLERCRELLGMTPPAPTDPPADYRDRFEALTGRSLRECPHCRTGVMVVISCVARPGIGLPPDTS